MRGKLVELEPGKHVLHPEQGKANSMICDPILLKVERAYTFRPISSAHKRTPLRISLGIYFLSAHAICNLLTVESGY
jgi:hypothetical protein